MRDRDGTFRGWESLQRSGWPRLGLSGCELRLRHLRKVLLGGMAPVAWLVTLSIGLSWLSGSLLLLGLCRGLVSLRSYRTQQQQAKHPSAPRFLLQIPLCGGQLRCSDPECSHALLPRAAGAHRGRCGFPVCTSLELRGLSQSTLLRSRHSLALRTWGRWARGSFQNGSSLF